MEENPVHAAEEYVRVFDAPDQQTADLVCATLRAGGVRAVGENLNLHPGAGYTRQLGSSLSLGALVPASEADAAKALLAEAEPTEEEIAAAMEADGMTLEEAEAEVR